MGTTIQTLEDHRIDTQISHSIEIMEVDFEIHLSTIRLGTGETMENFFVLHRLKGENSHKIIPTASQELINLTTLPSYLTTDLRLVLRPTNKCFRETIIKHHLIWFPSPQPTIPLTNCRIFAR